MLMTYPRGEYKWDSRTQIGQQERIDHMSSCACFSATNNTELLRDTHGNIPFEGFIDLRQHCSALREVLLPDEIWPEVLQWHRVGDDVASHSSVVLLAYRRGRLPKVTGPIHRYLLIDTGIFASARKQYLKDLCEKWMLNPDPGERHRLSRTFRGRLIELQYAQLLENQNHAIVGLEAIRQGSDIEARSPNGVTTSYEVKFVGMEDADFRMLIASMQGGSAGGPISPYQALNYLLFRIYEASVQLASVIGERVVVIVVDATAWFRFDAQVRGHWIDWSNPAFVQVDEAWRRFMKTQRGGGPSEADLRNAIGQISRVLLYQQNAAFEFKLELDAAIR